MAKSVARLKDVAAQTGFSVNTVSLALRGSNRIPDETRTLILQAAERLNYQPNHVARSLVQRETRSVGLILTDLTNPVLTAVAQAVEQELSKRGYTTLFATSNNILSVEAQMIETFRARRADGMLIFPCSHRQLDHIRALRKRNYPVVLLVGDPDAGIDAVCMDERAGAFKAAAHLINNGHTRIALIDGAATRGNTEKQEGYLRAHARMGITPDPQLMLDPKGVSVAAGFWAMDELRGRKLSFSAVFASNDSAGAGRAALLQQTRTARARRRGHRRFRQHRIRRICRHTGVHHQLRRHPGHHPCHRAGAGVDQRRGRVARGAGDPG